MSIQIRNNAQQKEGRPINKVLPNIRPLEQPILHLQQGASQVRTYSTASIQSAAITGDMVRLIATTACFVLAAPNPTVTSATGVYLAPNRILYLPIKTGDKIAAIRSSADGSLYITPTTP